MIGRYGVNPPVSSLITKAMTMNAMRMATAIEVTGRMQMKIVGARP